METYGSVDPPMAMEMSVKPQVVSKPAVTLSYRF